MALGPNDSLETSTVRLRNGIHKLLIMEHRNKALGKNLKKVLKRKEMERKKERNKKRNKQTNK